MERVNLINENNEMIDVNIIRYFKLNNNNYLIYSLNEIDQQNYVKLYAVKVETKDGLLISSNISDDNEWQSVKELIKVIIRGNKDGVAEVDDLNYKELESLKINENRVFKLSNQLTELLSANKKVIEEQPKINMEPISIESNETPEIDYGQPKSDNFFSPQVEPINNSIQTPNNAQIDNSTTESVQATESTQLNVEADYYKNLYEKEKAKNEELNIKLNEIKKLLTSI